MAHGLSIAFCPVSRKKVRFSLCDSHTLRLAREHAPMLLIFPPRHSIILPLSVCAGVSEWQTMRTQNPLVATPCGFKSHRRHHVGMDYAPFKKPSQLAGLFSYRSVIPPSPHKTLLHKLSRGPAALCSIQSARPFGRAFLVPPAQNHQIQKPLPLCLSTFLRQAPIFARRAGENFGIIHNYEPMFLYGMMIPVTSNRKGI